MRAPLLSPETSCSVNTRRDFTGEPNAMVRDGILKRAGTKARATIFAASITKVEPTRPRIRDISAIYSELDKVPNPEIFG